MLDLVGVLWSAERTCGALGLTDDEINGAVVDDKVMRLTAADGTHFFPLFQFEKTSHGKVVVRQVIQAFLAAFHAHDPWTVATVVCAPAVELDGLTPLEAARAGHPIVSLREFAEAVAAELADSRSDGPRHIE